VGKETEGTSNGRERYPSPTGKCGTLGNIPETSGTTAPDRTQDGRERAGRVDEGREWIGSGRERADHRLGALVPAPGGGFAVEVDPADPAVDAVEGDVVGLPG
jgi:hypothetical protein